MALSETALPVCRAHELARQPAEQAWLALAALAQQGAIRRTAQGWTAFRGTQPPEAPPPPSLPVTRTSPRHPPNDPRQCTLALEPPVT